MSVQWTVVIPVKDPARGKSRLALPRPERTRLAAAIALDTIAAAAACVVVDHVVVVGEDNGLLRSALDLTNVRFVAEGRERSLNGALSAGAAVFEGMPRAALLADLPALRPEELQAALDAAATVERAVVPDAEGTGSTLVTAAAGVSWASAFGENSLARHVALGCTVLKIDASSTLRRDVDTVTQLGDARLLGLGPRTSAELATSR